MHNLIHWYNENREKIWIIIIFAIFVILGIRVLNGIVKQNNQQKSNTAIVSQNSINDNFNTVTVENEKSILSGEKITSSQEKAIQILDSFVTACKQGNIETAYNLLSADCKDEMYPTIELFKNNYYNVIFNGVSRDVTAENWTGNTYKVKYTEDALSTGNYNGNNDIQDYITSVTEDGEVKLNINNFIGRESINKTVTQDGIEIKVVESNIYMDYQTYKFEITNTHGQTVLIDSLENLNTMYLEDSNSVKYSAYTNEIAGDLLKLTNNEKKTVTIKYYSSYSSQKTIKNIVFSKVILNYGAYSSYSNVGYYNDYGTIDISL